MNSQISIFRPVLCDWKWRLSVKGVRRETCDVWWEVIAPKLVVDRVINLAIGLEVVGGNYKVAGQRDNFRVLVKQPIELTVPMAEKKRPNQQTIYRPSSPILEKTGSVFFEEESSENKPETSAYLHEAF